MKALLHRMRTHPRYSKAFEWGKLASMVASAQMLVQGLGVLSGVLIIQLLPAGEYALYTLTYAMLGTIVPPPTAASAVARWPAERPDAMTAGAWVP